MFRRRHESPDASLPKYVQISQQLTARIRDGEWDDGRIPTVRDIAEEYGVSAYTVSRALYLLQERGLVVTRDRSGCFVAPAARPTAGRLALVLRVTPGPFRDASAAASLAGFDRVAAEDGVPFVRLPFDVGDQGDAKAVAAAAVGDGARGLILLPSRVSDEARHQDEELIMEFERAGRPVVLADRNLLGEGRPLTHDLVASDHFDGGRVCTRHLIDAGRRTIACVIASATTSHADRLAGYLFALQSAGLEPVVFRVPADLGPKDAYAWLADRVTAARADAVVCYQDYIAVGLILELFRRSVNVPRDVAVAGCDDLPIGSSFSLGVTTYAYPSTEIARWAVRLMANRLAHPADPPAKVLLPGRLVVRDST